MLALHSAPGVAAPPPQPPALHDAIHACSLAPSWILADDWAAARPLTDAPPLRAPLPVGRARLDRRPRWLPTRASGCAWPARVWRRSAARGVVGNGRGAAVMGRSHRPRRPRSHGGAGCPRLAHAPTVRHFATGDGAAVAAHVPTTNSLRPRPFRGAELLRRSASGTHRHRLATGHEKHTAVKSCSSHSCKPTAAAVRQTSCAAARIHACTQGTCDVPLAPRRGRTEVALRGAACRRMAPLCGCERLLGPAGRWRCAGSHSIQIKWLHIHTVFFKRSAEM